MSDITLLLDAIARGESGAAEDFLPLVYDELRRLAAARMMGNAAGQTLQPTALVHEAWLRLVNENGRTWQNRAHFFRAAAQAMRSILVDRARHKLTLKCGGGLEKVSLENVDPTASTTDDRVLMVDASLERLEIEDPKSARVITLKYFGGLTNKEVANILGVTERTVERQWAYAKACLLEMIKAER
jgi:RNA polymerase sigma factor (TIGR02999 family)